MGPLEQCSESQLLRFMSIGSDQRTVWPGAENDLIVGEKQGITLSLPPNSRPLYRDIVVLGHLIIKSTSDDESRPFLVARDIFLLVGSYMEKVNFNCRDIKQIPSAREFRELAMHLYFERLRDRKLVERQIGLQSILVFDPHIPK